MKIPIKEDILANISRSKAYTEIGHTSSHYSWYGLSFDI